jgi:hypothetical protein
VLVEHLPPDSAYARATDPDRYHEWTEVSPQLLREIHLELQLLRFMWADEASRGAVPERIPFPWEAAEQQARDEELVAQLRANE